MNKLSNEIPALTRYLDMQTNKYREELRQLCAIDSTTFQPTGINLAGAWVTQWGMAHRWEVVKWPDEQTGESLVVTASGHNPQGLRVLLVSHLDSMPFMLTALKKHSFRQQDDRLIYPGIANSKSSVLNGLYAMDTLEYLGLLAPFGCISLVCASDGEDETSGRRSSSSLLQKFAPDYDLALILQSSGDKSSLITARRGYSNFTLKVAGNPTLGEESIIEISRYIAAIQRLNQTFPDTKISIDQIRHSPSPSQGTLASARISTWVRSAQTNTALDCALQAIISPTPCPTLNSLTHNWTFAPFEETPVQTTLVALAKNCAEELDFTLTTTRLHSVSHANILAGLGLDLPILDGFGPAGGLFYTTDEFVYLSGIMPKIALLSLLMLRKAQQYRTFLQ